jgi:hypothetical protein
MHRSGTTFTGRILSHYPELQVVHEPLNKEYGLMGVGRRYPCDLDPEQGREYLEMLEKTARGEARLISKIPGDPWFKAAVRPIVGGLTRRNILALRLRRIWNRRLLPLFKDPFEVMLSRTLLAAGHKVLILVRHPAAVWTSIRRMQWVFSFADFAYPNVLRDLGLDAPPIESLSKLPEMEKSAWLWRVIYSYVGSLPASENLLVLRHEDLCDRPFETVGKIERFMGLAPRPKVASFIAKHMFAEKTLATGRTLHEFERNSQKLSSAWKEQLSDQETRTIASICGPQLRKYYPE